MSVCLGGSYPPPVTQPRSVLSRELLPASLAIFSTAALASFESLGVAAALQQPATVYSRCEQTHTPLALPVGPAGPAPSPWIFHSLVPAAKWWDDLVFT